MNLKKLLLGTLAAIGLSASSGSAATNLVSGYLYGTNNWSATNVYILNGFTYVMSNSVVNIEPGTVIQGVAGTSVGNNVVRDFGCLFSCAGGKINAIGLPTKPIIFTADVDDVTDPSDLLFPSRQLWGGIVMLGNATLNNAAAFTAASAYDIYEGLPDTAVTNTTAGPYLNQVDYLHRFGGSNDADSSGVLRYVSIRHGGKKLSADKEINGLSLGGVGNGTVIEYVEAYCIGDDGFEFFGGSVNTKYLISAFNDDDGFDTDQGWHGKNQFWFGIQEPAAKDSGSEQNGQPNSPDVIFANAVPLSNYEIRNATLIGAGTNTTGNDALRIRRDNDCKWFNSVITDFGGVRVRIDDDAATNAVRSTPTIENNLFFGFRAGANEDYGGEFVPAALNPVADPLLGGVSRQPERSLDPTLRVGSPAWGYGRTEDSGLHHVDYVGAFGSENWAQDWTALGNEGFFKATAIRPSGPVGVLPPVAPIVGVSRTETGIRLAFATVSGRTYTVQTRTALGSGGWAASGSPTPGTGSAVSVDLPLTGVAGFFRVVVE